MSKENHKLATEPCSQNVMMFRKASPENLMFAEVEVLKYDYEYDKLVPEWEGLVACTGVQKVNVEDDYYGVVEEKQARFRAIEDGRKLNDVMYGYHLKASAGFPGTSDNFIIKKMYEPTQELIDQYNKCMDGITVRVNYRDYSDTMNKYGMVEEIKGTEVEEIVEGAHSLDEGYAWMIQNHPGQLMGVSISTSSGDFSLHAVPCMEYEEGMYETRANREKYAAQEAERLNVKLGEFNYDLADSILKQQSNSVDRGVTEFDDIVTDSKKMEDTGYEKA